VQNKGLKPMPAMAFTVKKPVPEKLSLNPAFFHLQNELSTTGIIYTNPLKARI
jgi:hypothetical protein